MHRWVSTYYMDWVIFWLAYEVGEALFTKHIEWFHEESVYKTDCITLWTDTDYEDEAYCVYKIDWVVFQIDMPGLWRNWSPIYQTGWMIFWIDIQAVKEVRLHLQNI